MTRLCLTSAIWLIVRDVEGVKVVKVIKIAPKPYQTIVSSKPRLYRSWLDSIALGSGLMESIRVSGQ